MIKIKNHIEKHIISIINDPFIERARNNLYQYAERLNVGNIIFLLIAFNVIDIETSFDLEAVIKFRNKLVHPAREGIGFQHTINQKEAKRLLLKAKKRIQQISETKV